MQVDVSEENENAEEEPYIVDNPTMVKLIVFIENEFKMTLFFLFQDVESYANSYNGMAKLYRLMYIADHCPVLRIEALKMAIAAVQETFNVNLYQQLHRKMTNNTPVTTPSIRARSACTCRGQGGGVPRACSKYAPPACNES